MAENKRNSYVDYLKGICIVLVLLGHCVQYGNGASFLADGLYWENPLMKIVYTFHMPLFIAISGYLFYTSFVKYGCIQVCVRRFKKLICPITTWAMILTIAKTVRGGGTIIELKTFMQLFLTDFWFLWAVLICSALVAIVEKTPKRIRPVLYLSLVATFFVLPDWLWWSAYKFMFPFFLAGFYCAKENLQFLKNKVVGWSAVMGWIVLSLFYNRNSYIYTTGFTLIRKDVNFSWEEQLSIDLYRYLVGFAGCIAMVYLTSHVYELLVKQKNVTVSKIIQAIEKLGQDSLYLYILSTYSFSYIMPLITKNLQLNYIVTLIETALVALICEAVAKLLLKSHWVSKFLLGA